MLWKEVISMRIFEYTENGSYEELRSSFRETFSHGCVLALGFFDGVHKAHRELIKKARERAEGYKLPLAVFTFSSEDESFKSAAKRIYSTADRLSLLAELSVDAAVVCDFSAVRDIPHADFISDIIIGCLDAKCAVCGFNFRFGKGAMGDADFLSAKMTAAGRECLILSELSFDDSPLSSTLIRELLANRDITAATEALGKPYFISGEVVHGRGFGREYGIPTVNTFSGKDNGGANILLPTGVYRTATVIDGITYEALTNVGTCPTFGERELHAETFILDFDGDLYGKTLRIYFLGFLREERVFESEKALKMQIIIDKKRTKELNGDIKWQELGLS